VLADGVVDEHALPPPLEELGDVAVRHHPQQAANPLVKDAFTAQHVDVGVNYDLLGMPKPETNILGGGERGLACAVGHRSTRPKKGDQGLTAKENWAEHEM
jgi:hypothetical protein